MVFGKMYSYVSPTWQDKKVNVVTIEKKQTSDFGKLEIRVRQN